jgi:site-specific DNA-methyltransferase (adenine-specific)
MTSVTLLHGDTLHLLTEVVDDGKRRVPRPLRDQNGKFLRADACITDPPYNVDLGGDRGWDSFQRDKFSQPDEDFRDWIRQWAYPLQSEVLGTGALIAAFNSARTVHALMFGLQKSNYELIDVALWLYATGQVKHKHILKPAYEPIVIARRKTTEDLTKLFNRTGRAFLHAQELKAETGKHPLNVEIADPELVEENEDIRGMAKFLYVAKPSASERDYGCENLPLRRKEGGISGNALIKRDELRAKVKAENPGLSDAEVKARMDDILSGALARNIHPTVKPIDLMRRLVRLLTKPGATVIDPFMGSGTTGIACVLEDRNFIGIEREADFIEISSHRIGKALREVGNEAEATRLLSRLDRPNEQQAA